MSDCINCSEKVTTDYCGHCGQYQLLPAHTRRQFLIDLWATLSLINSPLKRTIIQLWRSPGLFVREYINGKQVGRLGPVQFFIMVLALYVIILPFVLDHEFLNNTLQLSQPSEVASTDRVINPGLILEKIPDIVEFVKQAVNFFYFLLPFALALYLPEAKNKAQSGLILSASFYFVAMSLILVMPFLLLSLWKSFFLGGRFIVAVSYLVFAYQNLYKQLFNLSIVSLFFRIVLGYLTYTFAILIIVAVWLSLQLVI